MTEPNNDHAIHDQIRRAPWLGSHEVGNTGYRFARIDRAETDTFIEILQVRAIFL